MSNNVAYTDKITIKFREKQPNTKYCFLSYEYMFIFMMPLEYHDIDTMSEFILLHIDRLSRF